MSSTIFTPFTEEQLIPKEEKLEVLKKGKKFSIGIPKETCLHEKRLCITPDAVQVLVEHGHDIILEAGAGEGSFFTDLQFSEAGAQITTSQAEVYGQDLVLKINPPTEEEMEFLKPNAYLVSALQINLRDKDYFKKLAEKKVKTRDLPEISGILIPYKNISEILRIFGEFKGSLKVCFNKNAISFSSDSIYLTSRVIDGIFPDYGQIIPKESTTTVVVLKQDLLNALKLTNIFSDKFNQVNVKVSPKGKIFELSSNNNDVGENKTQLDAAINGEEVELGFNYKYFLDCFQSITTDSVSIKFAGPTKPIVIGAVSDSSFTYLIMPMNK